MTSAITNAPGRDRPVDLRAEHTTLWIGQPSAAYSHHAQLTHADGAARAARDGIAPADVPFEAIGLPEARQGD